MKKGTHTIPHLRPMTAADYSHIVQLAAKNSEGLDARCARYRRRLKVCRGVATACRRALGRVGTTLTSPPPPQYTESMEWGNTTPSQASSTVELMICKL